MIDQGGLAGTGLAQQYQPALAGQRLQRGGRPQRVAQIGFVLGPAPQWVPVELLATAQAQQRLGVQGFRGERFLGLDNPSGLASAVSARCDVSRPKGFALDVRLAQVALERGALVGRDAQAIADQRPGWRAGRVQVDIDARQLGARAALAGRARVVGEGQFVTALPASASTTPPTAAPMIRAKVMGSGMEVSLVCHERMG